MTGFAVPARLLSLLAILGAMLALPVATRAASVPLLSLGEAAARLSAGGYVLMLRHAAVRANAADESRARTADCSGAPELSGEGLDHARRLGAALKQAGIRIDEVSSAAGCRCQETAQAAFGGATVWPALNFFPSNLKAMASAQGRDLQAAMGAVKAPRNAVWVTQQVNITALTGFVPAAREILAVRLVQGRVQAEFRFNPLP